MANEYKYNVKVRITADTSGPELPGFEARGRLIGSIEAFFSVPLNERQRITIPYKTNNEVTQFGGEVSNLLITSRAINQDRMKAERSNQGRVPEEMTYMVGRPNAIDHDAPSASFNLSIETSSDDFLKYKEILTGDSKPFEWQEFY